ncbi:MAG: site-specific integrase [Bacteroidota bacterium]|nr:site-specific integrase [Bacteroidota bacterium]
METVILKPLLHRGERCIGIYFQQNDFVQKYIQKITGAKWSRTNKCWHIPFTQRNYEELVFSLSGKVNLETNTLKEFPLENKKQKKVLTPNIQNKIIEGQEAKKSIQANQPYARQSNFPHTLSKENKYALELFNRELILKSYSQSTIRTYTNEFLQFLSLIKDKPANDFSVSRIKDYLQYCHAKLNLSENTLHSRMNALKFYFEQVLKREKFFWDIPRPKRPLILPKLLNEIELIRLFNALNNKKHKAMLFTAYSGGLRVSEIVNLKIADIDSGRMQIFIERAKGKKDRYVNLSPVLLDILRNYLSEYKPRPKVYLFESEQTLSAYPTRTAQQIFSNAKNKAGIKKEVGIHSLRHSFATHLLDKGTDIKYIKDLLGHFNIKTTERYLHVSKEKLVNIVSPFDDLWKKETIDW